MWKMGPAPRQKNHDTFMDGLAIVIRGNKATKNVSTGDLVLVENSTISGVSDGGYKALSSVSAGTAFTSANLSALSKGAVNALSDHIETIESSIKEYKVTATASGTTFANVMSAFGETSYPNKFRITFISDDNKSYFDGFVYREAASSTNCVFAYSKLLDYNGRYLNTNANGIIAIYDPTTSTGVSGEFYFRRI